MVKLVLFMLSLQIKLFQSEYRLSLGVFTRHARDESFKEEKYHKALRKIKNILIFAIPKTSQFNVRFSIEIKCLKKYKSCTSFLGMHSAHHRLEEHY